MCSGRNFKKPIRFAKECHCSISANRFARRTSPMAITLRQRFAPLAFLMDNPRREEQMPPTSDLFALLNELIVLLLGGLLILLALTHSLALPSRPALLIVLGTIFIFWASRTWAQPAPNGGFEAAVRAGSLAIVGGLLIAIPLFGIGQANLLLQITGAVLVIRGIVGACLFLRALQSRAR